MSLLSYWPTVAEVNNCIKSEAESASDEVLLAVHQQFPLAYAKVGQDGKVAEGRTGATEEDLLRHLLGNAPEGSLVVPITGASGVGKSHLIRLLDARLRRLPNAHRYLVIRIPKSASLRRVVDLILETDPLQDPKYDGVKAEFSKALADVPLDEAVIRFQSQLEISLNEYAGSLRLRLQQDPTDSACKEKLNHAMKLPKLIADAETVKHFRLKVLPRIIHRAVVGIPSEQGDVGEVDPTEGQFRAEDFNLYDSDLGQAAVQVATYYRTNLEAFEGRGKSIAAEVLNAVVDQSTRQLYQLNQSLGGMTLGEVILEIRRLLLADNRDLVILVEDFAALVGIQDTLAKVLIQEGATSKGKEYATIRSAIAVTDGYLAGRDTLATRAGREWVVESRLDSEEEALRRTRLLVASYINAARCGEARLKTHYQKMFEGKPGKENWSPPVYSDDEDDGEALKAFGYEGGVPLFPFTGDAIECLARSALKSGNALVFNPRFVIKNVIREVLFSGRQTFEEKQFPPPGLEVGGVGGEVSEWLGALALPEDQKRRYKRLVTTWGNNPQNVADIGRIAGMVFEVFGLPAANVKPVAKPLKPVSISRGNLPITPNPQIMAQTKAVDDFNNALENWVQKGVQLEQGIANKIRQALAFLINQRIDWNAERCLKREIRFDRFSIPNARGQQGLAADAIKIAPDCEDSEGRLRGELIALLRYFEVYKAKMDYDGVDDDLARIANLLDRLLPDVLMCVRASTKKQTDAAILALAANSRLLGASERGRTVGAVSSFLFSEIDAIEVLPDGVPQPFRDWRSMQSLAFQARPQIKQLLLETSGCFQGMGKTVNGVDIVRLVENYPDDSVKIELADLGNLSPDLKLLLQNLSDLRVNARLNQVLQEAKKVTRIIEEELGVEFDKNEVVDVLKALADKLKIGGAWSAIDIGFTSGDFTKSCEAFRAAAVKECLALLQKVEEPDNEEEMPVKKVSRVAQVSLLPLIVTGAFLDRASKVVKSANKHTQFLELQFQGVTPTEKAQEIEIAFDNLLADLVILQKGEE